MSEKITNARRAFGPSTLPGEVNQTINVMTATTPTMNRIISMIKVGFEFPVGRPWKLPATRWS